MTIRYDMAVEMAEDLFGRGMRLFDVGRIMKEWNDTLPAPLFVRELSDILEDAKPTMPNCNALLYEVALKAWRDGKHRSYIVPDLWSRASSLFISNGTRTFMTTRECGEIADEARADYIAEQAGAAHANATIANAARSRIENGWTIEAALEMAHRANAVAGNPLCDDDVERIVNSEWAGVKHAKAEGAGGLHAETWTLAELSEFCDEFNVCISRRANKWNAFYGSGRIVSEADWATFISKVSEIVT